ncbi:MAG TPA: 8-amino-7-oxononanoate synthase [Streptosporangiaceae bacterium]|nr:8-amino-7-oxononanoate synthase [Streptosporangiaceae bacterium]
MSCGHQPIVALRAAAAAREAAGLRRALTVHAADLVDLASNDYLGLATDPRVVEAAAAGAREWGAGATGSRLVTGTTPVHAMLEHALADFAGAQSALVFSSGYLANLATVTALAASLAGPAGTLVVSDASNHASLVDACRLARARVEVTPHQDVAAVERALAHRASSAAVVVTESAFSVGGSLAPLGALHGLIRAHGGLLVIDEAHAFGVVGPGGRGAAAAAGLAGEPDVVRTVTLSKALGTQGGAVLGCPEVTGTLVDSGRGFIFDTALAPPCAAAALSGLRILEQHPDLPESARANAVRLAATARDAGLEVIEPGAAVVRVVLGDPALATKAQRLCTEHGVLAGCFRPPSVPPGQSCLRLTARAGLSELDFAAVDRALHVVGEYVHSASVVGRK